MLKVRIDEEDKQITFLMDKKLLESLIKYQALGQVPIEYPEWHVKLRYRDDWSGILEE